MAYMAYRPIGKFYLKILSALVLAAVFLAAMGAWWGVSRADRTFTATVPALHIPTDTSRISHGRYLVYGPGHCADCHAAPANKNQIDSGREASLEGGYVIPTFLGQMRASNITTDTATGIGGLSDSILTQFMLTNINRHGQVGLPIMDFQGIALSDLSDIIAYLRTTTPVKNEVQPSYFNLMGKITKGFFLEPFPVRNHARDSLAPTESKEYGEYLANSICNCAGCHTARNMKTGEFTGARFAGGLVFRKAGDPTQVLVSPNLTPNPKGGIIYGWTREAFLARFRMRGLKPWTPMAWGPFSRMTDTDLGAIFLYLQNLEPAPTPPSDVSK